jgi:hypothetical protein
LAKASAGEASKTAESPANSAKLVLMRAGL